MPSVEAGHDPAAAGSGDNPGRAGPVLALWVGLMIALRSALSTVDRRLSTEIVDDREHLRPGDRVLLVIEDDVKFARILVGLARDSG